MEPLKLSLMYVMIKCSDLFCRVCIIFSYLSHVSQKFNYETTSFIDKILVDFEVTLQSFFFDLTSSYTNVL